MNKKTAITQCMKNFNEQSAIMFLVLLLCVDLVFIALHLISTTTPYINNKLYFLGNDRGFPEAYQFIKWFWIVILLANAVRIKRSFYYAVWAIAFMYILFDDVFMIHERVGSCIALKLDFIPPLGLRLKDLGELTVSALAGIVLISLVMWAYSRGEETFRKVSQDMLMLILALVFFGVVVDMLHIVINPNWTVNVILCAIEDGGEMLVASLILWYVFLLSARDETKRAYIVDCVCMILTRNAR